VTITVLCVTQAALRIRPFLQEIADLAFTLGGQMVFGAHGEQAREFLGNHWEHANAHDVMVPVEGGYLEQMLPTVLEACKGDYVLRLDDDERCSPEMVAWLVSGAWTVQDSWFFSRYHLWPDVDHVITSSPFFPDFQQRLTTREKAGRGTKIHAGSKWPAYRAPVYMEHHNFLVKTKEERRAMTAKYHTILTGVTTTPEQVNIVAPEDWNVKTESLSDSLGLRAAQVAFWRQAGMALPPDLKRELEQ